MILLRSNDHFNRNISNQEKENIIKFKINSTYISLFGKEYDEIEKLYKTLQIKYKIEHFQDLKIYFSNFNKYFQKISGKLLFKIFSKNNDLYIKTDSIYYYTIYPDLDFKNIGDSYRIRFNLDLIKNIKNIKNTKITPEDLFNYYYYFSINLTIKQKKYFSLHED